MEAIVSFFENFTSASAGLAPWYIWASRLILPVLAAAVLYRSARSMLRERYEPEVWAYLGLPSGEKAAIRNWECVIGRARSSDVYVSFPTVSRVHAAMLRGADGIWRVTDLGSRGGVEVNGVPVAELGAQAGDGDTITLGGVPLEFICLTDDERREMGRSRTRPGRFINPGVTLFILTAFQLVLALVHSLGAQKDMIAPAVSGFAVICAAQWCAYAAMRALRRTGFEPETLAFFLTTLSFSVTATFAPGDMMKQAILFLSGFAVFIALGWWLRDLGRTKLFRLPAAGIAIALLGVNLIFAQEVFGARNWIEIAGFSLQPSEFVKIAFIYTGAATLDMLFTRRNLYIFIAFSAVCVGALAIMGDFGTALVFFAVFLLIAFMRSGSFATVLLAVTGAGLAGILALSIKPHIAARFASWGHVWESVNDAGYQQTRALSAAASGGLFGLGAGKGWLKGIVAADTDLVFCLICEELGLLVAICAVLAVTALAAFAVRCARDGRSSFYVIAACAASALFVAQMGLNVFGSTDILPFTGVTFPFVSRGGSSLISCWALLAFIKAADTRQNASFAISGKPRIKSSPAYGEFGGGDDEEYDGEYDGDGYTDGEEYGEDYDYFASDYYDDMYGGGGDGDGL